MYEAEQRGRETGEKIGEQQTKINIAKNMLSENFDADVIARISGLSIKQILSLKNEQEQ